MTEEVTQEVLKSEVIDQQIVKISEWITEMKDSGIADEQDLEKLDEMIGILKGNYEALKVSLIQLQELVKQLNKEVKESGQ
jgi:mevalonate kinase